MTRLLPTWLQPWRGRCCGNRHDPLRSICPYTNIPRDLR